jgi:PAS domain S-box-containing protein
MNSKQLEESPQVVTRWAELEKATQFFRFFVEKVQHTVFWVRDPTGTKQLYVSPNFEKLWGYSVESLYENPHFWGQCLLEEDRIPAHTLKTRLEMFKQQGPEVKFEYRYRIKNKAGEILWIKDTSYSIYNEENVHMGFAGIAEDITKDVLQEQELCKAKQHAEIANQSKSDFLAMVSHELRTPLNAILGMAQILQTKEISADLKEYVNIINDAGNNLLSLVNDILDFIKLEAGRLSFSRELFNLHELFSEVVNTLQYQTREKNLKLSLALPDDLPLQAVADPNRIRQVLVNLITNAIKFTEAGHVKVRVKCLKKLKRKVEIEVEVEDTGIGIKQEKLQSIFEKFNQIDSIYGRKHQGLGLGLSITKGIIDKMGGKIAVQSSYGKGTIFTFTLALTICETNRVLHSLQEEKELLQHKYPLQVLLVEDNLINQKVAKLMLTDLGCEVDILGKGETVLAQGEKLSRYDLIFMDIGLPGLSGFEVAKQLRTLEALHRVPIVALTAHVLERDRQQAIQCGMDHIIPKPLTYLELRTILEWVVRRKAATQCK